MDTLNYSYSNILTGSNAALSEAREPEPQLAPLPDAVLAIAEPSLVETATTLSKTKVELPETVTGQAVMGVVSAAYDLADTAAHPNVDMDCVVCVLARYLPQLLGAAGVVDVEGLRTQLVGHIMGPTSAGVRADKPPPPIGDDVMAVLHCAQTRAREKGRSESTIEDLLDAIACAIRTGHYQSLGAVLLRARWRIFANDNVLAQVMARLDTMQKEFASEVDRTVEWRVRQVLEQFGIEHRVIERIAIEVDSVSRRLPNLRPLANELPEIPKTRPQPSWEFMKRLFARRQAE